MAMARRSGGLRVQVPPSPRMADPSQYWSSQGHFAAMPSSTTEQSSPLRNIVRKPTRVVVFDFDQTIAADEISIWGWDNIVDRGFGGEERVSMLRTMLQQLVERNIACAIVSFNTKSTIERALSATRLLGFFRRDLIFGATMSGGLKRAGRRFRHRPAILAPPGPHATSSSSTTTRAMRDVALAFPKSHALWSSSSWRRSPSSGRSEAARRHPARPRRARAPLGTGATPAPGRMGGDAAAVRLSSGVLRYRGRRRLGRERRSASSRKWRHEWRGGCAPTCAEAAKRAREALLHARARVAASGGAGAGHCARDLALMLCWSNHLVLSFPDAARSESRVTAEVVAGCTPDGHWPARRARRPLRMAEGRLVLGMPFRGRGV